MNGGRNDNGDLEKIFEDITEFLRQLAWNFEPISRRMLKAHYQGEFGPCEVMIHINSSEICLVIDPVLERSNPAWGKSVIRLVNAMSEEIKHIDLGLDGQGDLFVKVSLPTAHINLERFHCLLLGLCQVAENIVVPILQANAFDNLQ
jgi:hypothetical protein